MKVIQKYKPEVINLDFPFSIKGFKLVLFFISKVFYQIIVD